MLIDFRLRLEVSAVDWVMLGSAAVAATLLYLRNQEGEYRGLTDSLQGRSDRRLEEAWRSSARLFSAVKEAERRF